MANSAYRCRKSHRRSCLLRNDDRRTDTHILCRLRKRTLPFLCRGWTHSVSIDPQRCPLRTIVSHYSCDNPFRNSKRRSASLLDHRLRPPRGGHCRVASPIGCLLCCTAKYRASSPNRNHRWRRYIRLKRPNKRQRCYAKDSPPNGAIRLLPACIPTSPADTCCRGTLLNRRNPNRPKSFRSWQRWWRSHAFS